LVFAIKGIKQPKIVAAKTTMGLTPTVKCLQDIKRPLRRFIKKQHQSGKIEIARRLFQFIFRLVRQKTIQPPNILIKNGALCIKQPEDRHPR